ncbi:integral membrane sensor signal transduction histidine kinase [Candidatus Magnetoovum chiemensis]|nr:integral membrane sensor signal transduction histidine kinase [Candidatus Magnetoovum chiemensis]
MVNELSSVNVISQRVEIIEAVYDINIAFLETRRYEKNIMLFHEQDNIDEFHKYLNVFVSKVHSLEDEIILETNRQNYFSLLRQIEEYKNDMESILKNIGIKNSFMEQIRLIGRQIVESSKDKTLALEMRRYEKNYFLFKEPDAVSKVQDITKQIILNEPNLESLINEYNKTFSSAVNSIVYENTVSDHLRKCARNIETTIVEIVNIERKGIMNLLARFKTYFVLSVGFFVLIIIIAGYFIAHNIVKTLKKIERSFKNIVKDGKFLPIDSLDGTYELNSFINEYNKTALKLKDINYELKNKISELEDINHDILIKQNSVVEMKKDAAIRLLAGEIAHEMNNPLSSVTSLLQVLYEDQSNSDTNKQLFSLMIKDNKRCHDILNNILNFARKENLKVCKADIKKIICDAVEIVERMTGEITINAVEEKFAHFVVNIEDMPKVVLLDPILIQQAIINLLTNAYNFSPNDGSITVSCAMEDNSTIKITVSDEGCGINEDVLPHIFDPFFSTRKDDGGHGLGLSITKKIVEKHSGTISVDSSIENGAAFVIKIPLIVFPSYR